MSKTKAASPKAISRTEVKAPGHLHLGELCPHYGGVFAGLVRGQNEKPDYYLFVPPDHTAQANLPWGGYEHEELGANDSHDGLANTIALCESKIDHPAAQFARDLELYGLKDYYMPSREELRLCFINCRKLFEPEWHWSSTQSSAYAAWLQTFTSGNQRYDHKANACRVRAVRRLLVIQ
jgi:hypothetical protein